MALLVERQIGLLGRCFRLVSKGGAYESQVTAMAAAAADNERELVDKLHDAKQMVA